MGLFSRSKNKKEKVRRLAKSRRSRLMWGEQLEDRRLLATLNLVPTSGNLIYSGDTAVNAIEVSFDGTNYTFRDTTPGAILTPIGGMAIPNNFAALDQDAANNVVTFNAAAADGITNGGAITQIILNGGVGNDSYTIMSLRGGAGEGLDIRDTGAADGNDSISITGPLGAAGSRLGNEVLLRADLGINLGGSIFTANRAATAFNAVTLSAASTVDTGTATTTLTSTVNGAFGLTVNAGLADFKSAVGGVTPVAGLTVNSTSIQVATVNSAATIGLTSTNSVIAAGNLTTTAGNVTLTAPTVALSNAGPFTFQSGGTAADSVNLPGVSSTFTPNLNLVGGSGAVNVSGAVGGIANFVASGNTVSLGGEVGARDISITGTTSTTSRGLNATAGNVLVTGPLTIGGAASTTMSATGTVTFTSTVMGNGGNLLGRTATAINFGGAVSNVGFFDIRPAAAGSVSVRQVAANNIGIIANTININGNLTAAVDDVVLTGNVVLQGASVMSSGQGTGDDVLITGAANGPHVLELRAGIGSVQNLGGAAGIGTSTPVTSLLASGGTVVSLQAVTVNGGDVVLEGGRITLNAAVTGDNAVSQIVFRPQAVGGTLEVYNRPSAPVSANMTVAANSFANITNFVGQQFGGNNTGTVEIIGDTTGPPITNQLVLTIPTTVIGNTIRNREIINQGTGANAITFRGNTVNLIGQFSNTGNVIIQKKDAGGTLSIGGNIGSLPGSPTPGFGQHPLIVTAVGSTVDFTGQVGGTLTTLDVTASTVDLSSPTAVNIAGNVNLNAAVSLNGGIFSKTGDIVINGTTTLTGNATFIVAPTKDLTVGDVVGAGFNIVVRGNNGALDTATFGNVTGAGSFSIDSSGANTAATVDVANLAATSILIRANSIETDGTISASTGNLHLIGPVVLSGNTTLTTLGASRTVTVNGSITGGGNNLTINSASTVSLTTGDITGVQDMFVSSVGKNYITQEINVLGVFNWNGNGSQVLVLQDINAGTSITFDVEARLLNGAALNAPVVNNP